MDTFIIILQISAPLLFITLGALCSEYAGVLAIFMEGTTMLAGFLTIVFTIQTGSPLLGFFLAALVCMSFLFLVALFTDKTEANPFLTGLAINLFSLGVASWGGSLLFGINGSIAFADFQSTAHINNLTSSIPSILAICCAVLLFLFVRYTVIGLNLKYSGLSPNVLFTHGSSPSWYKIGSWVAAGFFASCAGALLALRLGAYTPNLSAGRGWTALAAVFLGYRHPLFCVIAVFLFSLTEYITTVLQASSFIPSTLILAFPYGVALLVFIIMSFFQRKRFSC